MIASRYRLLAFAANFALLAGVLSAQVPGERYQAQGTRYQAPGTRYQASGGGYPVPGLGYVSGSELTVYLMTMGPGDEVWEKFGHNAIWIHDSLRNTDIAYNWGLFDFDAADFFPRFLRGDMRYWMGGFDKDETVDFYRRSNRSVWAQELNLTPAQRLSLNRFVEWNALPENRYYNYDYFRDNCSTRVRDVLDRALGGAIKRKLAGGLSGLTYRSETQRLVAGDELIYAGTMLGLGHPVDRGLDGWELGFLPGRLREELSMIQITDASGQQVPLATHEDTLFIATRPSESLFIATRHSESAGSYPKQMIFLVESLGLLLALISLARWADAHGEWRRNIFLLVAAGWSLVAGLAGTALVALWTLTNHVYSYRNENLFQANPLSLALAVMLLLGVRKQRTPSGEEPPLAGPRALQLALVIVALSAMGLLIKILPWFRQENLEIIVLMLPAHVGVALALGLSAFDQAGSGSIKTRLRRVVAPAS